MKPKDFIKKITKSKRIMDRPSDFMTLNEEGLVREGICLSCDSSIELKSEWGHFTFEDGWGTGVVDYSVQCSSCQEYTDPMDGVYLQCECEQCQKEVIWKQQMSLFCSADRQEEIQHEINQSGKIILDARMCETCKIKEGS